MQYSQNCSDACGEAGTAAITSAAMTTVPLVHAVLVELKHEPCDTEKTTGTDDSERRQTPLNA